MIDFNNILMIFQTNRNTLSVFPFFSIIRFPNTECPASGSFNGTCFTRRECHDLNGLSSGTCASKKGVCCVGKVCLSKNYN